MDAFTDGQTVIPPVVGALDESCFAVMVVEFDFLCARRSGHGPRSEVDEHHKQNGEHPLQQLLICQLEFVSRFDAIRQRYPVRCKRSLRSTKRQWISIPLPPSLHEERTVRQTESQVPRPLGGHAAGGVEIGENGRHLHAVNDVKEHKEKRSNVALCNRFVLCL